MPNLIMCKGLPASGKTTWAREQIVKAPKNSIKRVNKDDLRNMLDNGQWSKGNEDLVLQIRDKIIELSMLQGKHVIVDDTNLVPKHEIFLREMVKTLQLGTFVVQDFTHVNVDECINRDATRENTVGIKVIQDMYDKFLKGKEDPLHHAPAKRVHDPDKPTCIIVDIDGTLACNSRGRGWYEYDKVDQDSVHEHIRHIVQQYEDQMTVLLVSGRYDNCREITLKWLSDNGIPSNGLYMRKTGDNRCDTIIKREIFEEYIEPYYNVLFCLDDRDRVVKMWRELGIPCLQVAPGDF